MGAVEPAASMETGAVVTLMRSDVEFEGEDHFDDGAGFDCVTCLC